jgi:ATP phosphoribosyltransferase
MINVALPKGRLGEKAYALFARAGYDCPELLAENRRLTFENEAAGVRYFWVKPSDVAIYVERGAADVGVAGRDILLEYAPDVYELLDLNIGRCRLCVAGPKGFADPHTGILRVATKFPNVARKYYASQGREIDVIRLNGSIELAPILGLSDVIVDIVETGKTLAENDLCVLEEIEPVSARLVANKAHYKFIGAQAGALLRGLEEAVKA